MTETYEIMLTLYDGVHANEIQYVTDDDGEIYKINHNQHSFDYVWEHEVILDVMCEMKTATGIRMRSDADAASLREALCDEEAEARFDYLNERM